MALARRIVISYILERINLVNNINRMLWPWQQLAVTQ